MDNYGENTAEDPAEFVDEQTAYRLAEEHSLSPIEVDAALHGERVDVARGILRWIDEQEGRLVREFGLLEGRKRYRPVSMLRNWSRRHGAGS